MRILLTLLAAIYALGFLFSTILATYYAAVLITGIQDRLEVFAIPGNVLGLTIYISLLLLNGGLCLFLSYGLLRRKRWTLLAITLINE
jgi:hypothetical protein